MSKLCVQMTNDQWLITKHGVGCYWQSTILSARAEEFRVIVFSTNPPLIREGLWLESNSSPWKPRRRLQVRLLLHPPLRLCVFCSLYGWDWWGDREDWGNFFFEYATDGGTVNAIERKNLDAQLVCKDRGVKGYRGLLTERFCRFKSYSVAPINFDTMLGAVLSR